MDLLTYLKPMPLVERHAFAAKCGTTWGHLRNIAYGYKPCGESLGINIDRETDGQVTVENMCPDADWAYIRGRPLPLSTTKRKTG
jgi:hypothetical protein